MNGMLWVVEMRSGKEWRAFSAYDTRSYARAVQRDMVVPSRIRQYRRVDERRKGRK